LNYSRTLHGGIQSTVDADGMTVIFQASNVRNERTGVHSTISIGFREDGHGAIPLDEDTYNIGRREDRERLVTSIYKKGALKTILEAGNYDQSRMSMDLMLFQRGLWQYEVGSQEGERRGGATQRSYKPFVIEPYVVEGGGTIIFAPPGRGKSWLGMMMCVTVDAGINRFWPVKQGPALFVNLERSAESLDVRLGDINESLGLPRDRPLLRLDRRGRSLPDVIGGIQRTVDKEGVTFVMVDSLSRMGYGNLIDNDPANKAMDALNGLSPAAWAVLAHTPRGDETHTFGSQMFDAAADVTVQLMTDDKTKDDSLGIGLRVDKANDIKKGRGVLQIALEFDDFGLKAIRKAKDFEFLEISAQKKVSTSEQVATFLGQFGKSDAATIADELGIDRSTVANILRNGQYVSLGKEGRKAVYGLREPSRELLDGENVNSLETLSDTAAHPYNNEVVSVASPEYRGKQQTLPYVNEDEDIF